MIRTISIIWHTFSKYRWHIVGLVVLGFLGALFEGIGINAAIPLLSFLVNGGTPTDVVSQTLQKVFEFFHISFTFRYILLFIVLLFLSRAVANVIFGYIRGRISSDFLTSESQAMLRLTLFASWPFLLKQKLGHLHTTLVRDIQRTSNLLEALGQIIQSLTGFLMYLVVAFNISPITTFSTVIAGAVLLLLVRPFLKKTKNVGTAMASTEKKISHFLSEHIMGIKAIKASAAEEEAFTYGQRLFQSMQQLYIRMALTRSLNTSLFQPFSIIFVIILFYITYKSPGFSLISFAVTLYLIQKIFTYLESAQSSLAGVSELVPYAENIEKFKQLLSTHKEALVEGTKPFSFENNLRFEGVSLTYQGTKTVLTDLNFHINKGETVGLIGPSGAGKTSIADLMLRLFEPTSGTIMIDGMPLSQIRIDDWRTHIGYVAQDMFLLNTSIEENIRFYRPEISQEDIVAAAKRANSYEFVMSLPDGFSTVIGDHGVMLSGGQRQRIVLARALASRPPFLILDEATSALDGESEQVIQKAIQSLRGEVTVLIIAHRLSTIESTDRLIVLDAGKVIESGTPEELLSDKSSYFYRLKHG